MWTLPERYSSSYTTLSFTAMYEITGEPVCLQITRNKTQPGSSKRVLSSKESDGLVCALCESREQTESGEAVNTYYESYTGKYRYFIGRETTGFSIESILSMDEAIAMMSSPAVSLANAKLTGTEWNAYFVTDACNLEILVRPNDGGALVRSLSATHTANTEDGETIYVDKKGDDVAYTNGVDSVRIRQADRADAAHTDYHTLSECKAILALLGSD